MFVCVNVYIYMFFPSLSNKYGYWMAIRDELVRLCECEHQVKRKEKLSKFTHTNVGSVHVIGR